MLQENDYLVDGGRVGMGLIWSWTEATVKGGPIPL